MIKYNLSCQNGHEFESWFSNSEEFEKLNKKKLLECIYCSSKKINKSIMAPMVSTKNKDEQVEFLQKMFDGDTEWLDFKCCYEDEDTLIWKDLLYIKSEDRKFLVTNHEAFKDNLVWRIMLNPKEVSKEMEKIP